MMEGEGSCPPPPPFRPFLPGVPVPRLVPSIILTLSIATLAVTAVLWFGAGGDEARADLVGDPVSTTTTTTTAPVEILPPSAPEPTVTVPPPGVPARLMIPELGVDDAVIPVGLEDDGAMEVPPAELAGWYRYGVTPGSDHGSAVIAAHVDYEDRPGVFLELARLEVDAEVTVVDEAGMPHRYRVVERWQVSKDLLPIDELFRHDGDHVLTLITCGGAFDPSARSYDDNIVVRAVPA